MTGFGRARTSSKGVTIDAQLSSINKRGQEIAISLPREMEDKEAAIAELLRGAFERGKLSLTVRAQKSNSKNSAPNIEGRLKELKTLSKKLKIDFEPDTELLWEMMNTPAVAEKSTENNWPAIVKTIKEAIEACSKTQAAEGKKLQKDFLLRLKKLSSLRSEALKLSQNSLPLQRARLEKNLQSAGIAIDVKDERILKELALFADRVDVSEELTRIDAHLSAANKLIVAPGSIGRQLEFLLQELQREWNTLGNKSVQIELVQTALAAKNEIERMREQAANVV